MPEDDALLEEAGVETEGEGDDLAAQLLHWAPAGLFAFSLLYALVTVLMAPGSDRQRAKPAIEYYRPAARALDEARFPRRGLDSASRERRLTVARVNLQRLVYHYGANLDALTFPHTNPYLMLAETNRLLIETALVEQRRQALLRQAYEAYEMAEVLESRWDDETEAPPEWREQYTVLGRNLPGRPTEVEVRQRRRADYIRYQKAVLNVEMGRLSLAQRELEDLRRSFVREEVERLRAEKEGVVADGAQMDYPPADFELLPADKTTLHYHLARTYDQREEEDRAQREYRIFLLEAPRSRELFAAKGRLAEIAHARGKALETEARFYLGRDREEILQEAAVQYRGAAELYGEIVDQSAPEEFLRYAYFHGGLSYLELAETVSVGRATTWDVLRREGEALEAGVEALAGHSLPPEGRRIPEVVGRFLAEDALQAPSLLGTPSRLLLGGALLLATQDRETERDRRDALVGRARQFFEAAGTGEGGRYLAPSRVLIGRTLLLEGRLQEARRIFRHAMETYPFAAIRAGGLWGLAHSYLQEGRLDDAWQALSQLPSREDLPETALVTPDQIEQDGMALVRSYRRRAEGLRIPEDWVGSSAAGPMQWAEATRRAKEKRRLLERAAEVYRVVMERFALPDSELLPGLASLYAAQAALIDAPPFGSPEDRAEARQLRLLAADTYLRVAEGNPTAKGDEDTLLRSGVLFLRAMAHERAIEALERFIERHERSERANEVRNLLGQAYHRLGMFGRAERVFRRNAMDTANPEGIKSLFYLGQTYLDWGLSEPDRKHLGGPTSPLLQRLDEGARQEDYLLTQNDVLDWSAFIRELRAQEQRTADSPAQRLYLLLDEDLTGALHGSLPGQAEDRGLAAQLLKALNSLLRQPTFYDETAWREVALSEPTVELLRRGRESLPPIETTRLNRLLLCDAFPRVFDRGRAAKVELALPRTAREVFEQMRRMPNVGPESRPWRWSTFALGETLYEIARYRPAPAGDEADGPAPETAVPMAPSPELRLDYFRRAKTVLNEALARYVLYDEKRHPFGIRRDEAPEDYIDVQRLRFRASYVLALTHRELAQPAEAQRLLARLIDEDRYGPEVFQKGLEPLPALQRMRRNAYLYLGMSLYQTEDYEEAYAVFEQAHDRLKTSEGPYILYMMGECLYAQGRKHDARSKYIQARHAAMSAPAPEAGTFGDPFGKSYWAEVNEQRLADLQYLEQTQSGSQR